jgi:class I fructose-bisphosphate aldolase
MVAGIRAGARGAVVGRNIWGEANMEQAARAYAAVIHDGVSAAEAIASS